MFTSIICPYCESSNYAKFEGEKSTVRICCHGCYAVFLITRMAENPKITGVEAQYTLCFEGDSKCFSSRVM